MHCGSVSVLMTVSQPHRPYSHDQLGMGPGYEAMINLDKKYAVKSIESDVFLISLCSILICALYFIYL